MVTPSSIIIHVRTSALIASSLAAFSAFWRHARAVEVSQ
ncbi:hypothetical protein AKJ09_08046 [Labilithrix luteola]|uniref:Uncharacterized protein n=1 Tax=Labilithrix luteola TaxID=1391654 RepID=A0A0K1Q6M0_9BACT|nr:hypothetical protein AKJ09_08046 [Labilithrix luteola]